MKQYGPQVVQYQGVRYGNNGWFNQSTDKR